MSKIKVFFSQWVFWIFGFIWLGWNNLNLLGILGGSLYFAIMTLFIFGFEPLDFGLSEAVSEDG